MATDKIRLGVVGFAHMHINQIVGSFLKLPDNYEWIGCADTNPSIAPISTASGTRKRNMQQVIEKCVMPRTFDEYHDLLDESPDMVIVTTENALHATVAPEILSRGIHVIIEKPMALSLPEAQSMAQTAKQHNAKLIINWPTSWDPAFRLAQKLTADGAAGTPFKFHYRNKESLGPFSYGQNMTDEEKRHEWWYQADMGGGAMVDYIGYGCNLSRWFLGERAETAYATKVSFNTPFADVDDFAAATVSFPSAIALIEGSWATYSSGAIPCGPIVFGDSGTIVTDRLSKNVKVYTERHNPIPTGDYDAPPLPEGRSHLAEEVLHHLRTGEPLHETLDLPVNLDAMAAMDAAFRSAVSSKQEHVTP